uniref:Membrane-bound O-acyltransferase C24H6.01c n=1 Tax=Aegilops tauschii subsp. strangulata TaxID=200361 RepID=A0A452XYA9_AEGTS
MCAYAVVFYSAMVQRSLRLARDYTGKLYGLRAGSIPGRLNDSSDAQWRNFRGNLPVLTIVMAAFLIVANGLRYGCSLKGRGASLVWLILSLIYLCYLHGACVGFILVIAGINYAIVKLFARYKYCTGIIWSFNLAMLTLNRVYEGYSFSLFGQQLAFLDNYRGTFRWHICFNFVVLRMISFGCDYCWTLSSSHFDHKEKGLSVDKYTFLTYLCYLTYAPLYIAGPVVSYNAFAAQLDVPQKNYSVGQICCYGLRWILNFLLIEVMTHFFHYNAFVVSRLWRQLTPFEIFIISYGVLIFMWLKFFLIWRYFRFWSLVGGVETPENMPRCINNCPDLESFWKSWHASFNKWLVRYVYIPLGGSRRKLLSIWVVFTFVAAWHDLEWKLISWAWLTCLCFVPEIVIKSFSNNFQVISEGYYWPLLQFICFLSSFSFSEPLAW